MYFEGIKKIFTRRLNFIKKENPWVLRDITERLLEAYNRGMWKAKDKEIDTLKKYLTDAEKNIEECKY